jgi:hypothetical protein
MTWPRNQGLEEWRVVQRIQRQEEVQSSWSCAGDGLGMDMTYHIIGLF